MGDKGGGACYLMLSSNVLKLFTYSLESVSLQHIN